ncbi:hypothetical protein SAMN04490356_5791 [Streptomyces melanosporofaciens]|uniref:Uncharacterized protein n=1 Tax=Streptomyces melanosporofaciens TaxID=67327 RepID=A0A1H4VVR3_STRMJ|nr:hypothetical protein SAMN04490356_5791 [Streptomyces melanosporofaciens]
MTRLVNAVVVLRFTADAILRLWQSAARAPTAEHTAARAELLRAGGALVDWYERTARALAGEGPVPDPVDTGLATGRLVEAVNRDLGAADAGGTATDAGETTAGAHGAAAAIGMFRGPHRRRPAPPGRAPGARTSGLGAVPAPFVAHRIRPRTHRSPGGRS